MWIKSSTHSKHFQIHEQNVTTLLNINLFFWRRTFSWFLFVFFWTQKTTFWTPEYPNVLAGDCYMPYYLLLIVYYYYSNCYYFLDYYYYLVLLLIPYQYHAMPTMRTPGGMNYCCTPHHTRLLMNHSNMGNEELEAPRAKPWPYRFSREHQPSICGQLITDLSP